MPHRKRKAAQERKKRGTQTRWNLKRTFSLLWVLENKSTKKFPISYSIFGQINDSLFSLLYLPSVKQHENFKQQQPKITQLRKYSYMFLAQLTLPREQLYSWNLPWWWVFKTIVLAKKRQSKDEIWEHSTSCEILGKCVIHIYLYISTS